MSLIRIENRQTITGVVNFRKTLFHPIKLRVGDCYSSRRPIKCNTPKETQPAASQNENTYIGYIKIQSKLAISHSIDVSYIAHKISMEKSSIEGQSKIV